MDWYIYCAALILHSLILAVGVVLGIALERWRLVRFVSKHYRFEDLDEPDK